MVEPLPRLDVHGIDDDGVYHPPSRARYEELMARVDKLERLVRVVGQYDACLAEFGDQRGIKEGECLCAACPEHLAAMTDLARELDADGDAGDDVPVLDGAVHQFFGLSYSSYFVAHRTILQSMPRAWQSLFVALVEDARRRFPGVRDPYYDVRVRDEDGRFVADPIPPYDRGRTRLPPGWRLDATEDK